uniref:Odorant binding protein n=1 Tax=Stomoxys calcitrans TaxID=35570 RepID=A0A1I8QA54_STOCA
MKTFISLAVICLFVTVFAKHELTEEQRAEMKAKVELCAKEENISEAEVTKFMKEDYANPTEDFKCLTTCFFEKEGTLKDGVVQEEFVIKKWGPTIGEDNIKKIYEKCHGIKAENRCETGFKILECCKEAKEAL